MLNELSTNLQGFPRVINAQTRILILGSFPGVASLAQQQYYAFKHNQFWQLIAGVIEENLIELAYEKRLATVLKHQIGLWDVYQSCQREGSLDSQIRHAQMQDFAALQREFPALRAIVFNGQTAGKANKHLQALGFITAIAPSSSPANASQHFAEKQVKWQSIFQTLQKEI